MPTIKQEKLAKAIVENLKADEPKNKGELLESVGYAKNTAEAKPGEIIEQKGVQQALVDMGFTEDNAKKVVAEILNNPDLDPNSRLKAADMTFKVHGSYAPEKSQSINLNVNTDITPDDEKRKQLVEEFENKLFNDYVDAQDQDA